MSDVLSMSICPCMYEFIGCSITPQLVLWSPRKLRSPRVPSGRSRHWVFRSKLKGYRVPAENVFDLPMATLSVGIVPVRRRVIIAAIIGTALEFYDFTTYALFATIIGRQFFPVASESGQLLLALATFGVGFVTRPLGAVILGAYADQAGRKAALTLSLALMVVGTALIALTPSYATIGLAAPVLIVLARLLQGFSAGGEIGAATTYILASAPASRRGLYGSWQTAVQGVAGLAGSLMGFGLSLTLSPDSMDAWGWRVPFLFGLLIGPVGLYLRKHMSESVSSPHRKRL